MKKLQSTSKVKKMRLHLRGVRLNSGFTLVEIIVVMAIMAIVGTILVVIFTNTLRGSNKAQILASIKQNGQAVLENMDKTIRGANNVICKNDDDGNILVVKSGDIYTRYKFVSSTASVNGLIQQDNPVKQNVEGSFPPRQESDTEFKSRVCGLTDTMGITTGLTISTDTNPQSGVSVENGVFLRNESAGFKDQVTVKFDLKPGVQASSVISSQIDPVTFQTTVQLR